MDIWSILLNSLLLIVGYVLGLLTKSFLPDYFGQKGKNLATKEDIEEITKKTERARQRQHRKEEKANKINDHLNQFAELAELYAFFARKEERLVKDESGEFIRDEAGEFIIEGNSFEPEPRFEQVAKKVLDAEDFNDAINRRIIEIRLKSGEALDITREVDPSGELDKKFQDLYWQTVQSIEFWIKHEDFGQMVSSLREARQTRVEIISMLQDYLNNEQ